jgi:hypothetical protein
LHKGDPRSSSIAADNVKAQPPKDEHVFGESAMLQVGGFVPSTTLYAAKTPADKDPKEDVHLSIIFRHFKNM